MEATLILWMAANEGGSFHAAVRNNQICCYWVCVWGLCERCPRKPHPKAGLLCLEYYINSSFSLTITDHFVSSKIIRSNYMFPNKQNQAVVVLTDLLYRSGFSSRTFCVMKISLSAQSNTVPANLMCLLSAWNVAKKAG